MFFNSIKDLNRLGKEIKRSLSKGMFLKEINRFRKEISSLLTKRMSNIYLKVPIKTFSKPRFSGFKKFVTRSAFEELQLMQISLNIKTSCCNLKIRDLGYMAFLFFIWLFYYVNFERNYNVLKTKSPCILLTKI